jgi:phosphoribosylformylglycinamidine synthase
MEQKLNRVIRACIEMGDKNPILSIHDQGAGGPCNVLTEIVDPEGGRIEIRNIAIGDRTMSLLEIWVAEYQERNAFLIHPDDLKRFQNVCLREKINCEVLGEITGDGRITVHDGIDGTIPVDLELSKVLGKIPQKEFRFERIKKTLKPLEIPAGIDLEQAIRDVFRLPAVGSKGFLVRKVDRSVTGLVAGQQCCGPLQLPVADVSVIAQSHFGLTGAAISIGEQPLKILVNPEAGARMTAGEAVTNIMWARVSGIDSVKCSVNWMWPAKLPGEGAALWDAAIALSDLMKSTGIAADGGKDSISMAAQVHGETVKAPGEIVVSAYVTVPDIRKVVTPDIKMPGKSKMIFVDISNGKNRLGGSAFAQALGQTGDTAPDVEDAGMLVSAFKAVQEMIDKGLILAGHDRSDGGLITSISEMVMSGNCGLEMDIFRIEGDSSNKGKDKIFKCLFSEELGAMIEYLPENESILKQILEKYKLRYFILGKTSKEKKLVIKNSATTILDIEVYTLLEWWESTSDEIEKQQMNPEFAEIQKKNHIREGPVYNIASGADSIHPVGRVAYSKPEVAIIREEGSNGDREMTSAFHMAGFNTWDVTMTDLLKGDISLDKFRGVVFVGGFSYADVLDSAKGWAGIIRFNKNLSDMFDTFYKREDTFSLGVCNGCQLMTLLGWVPWRGIEEVRQPRFISNPSGRFESRWVTVKILNSNSIMLGEMENTVMGIWVAHREGYLHFPDKNIMEQAEEAGLLALAYVDDEGIQTEEYPYNPNSSPKGYTAVCSIDGRHLAMMPHPERAFLLWQWPWIPENLRKTCNTADPSPWLRMFQNARRWCEESQ